MPITYVGAGTNGVQTTAAADLQVPYPASGLAAGDLLLAPVGASVAGTWLSTAMSAAGFSRRNTYNSGGSSPSGALFWKWATGSETGSALASSPGGTSQGRMFAYRGVDPTNPFDVADVLWNVSTLVATYSLASQDPTVAGCAAFIHAITNTNARSYTPPTNYTELTDVATPTPGTEHAHPLNLALGATGQRDIVRTTSTRGAAIGVLLRPAGATPAFSGWGIPI